MKLAHALNFNGPEATCHSLRVLAEHARRGEVTVKLFDVRDADGVVRVDLKFTPEPVRSARQTAASRPADHRRS